jgi:hypothetical protein
MSAEPDVRHRVDHRIKPGDDGEVCGSFPTPASPDWHITTPVSFIAFMAAARDTHDRYDMNN